MGIILQDVYGRKYSLDKKLTIGSDSANRIVLLDSSSAPFHAEISVKKKIVQVKDLSNEQGVFINSERVSGTDAAFPGDTIWVGKVPFTVTELAPEAEKASRFEEDPSKSDTGTPVTIQTPGYVDIEGQVPQPDAAPEGEPEPVPVLDVESEPIPETVQIPEVIPDTEAEPVPAATTIQPPAGKPVNIKWILAIVGAVLLIGIVGVILIFSNSDVQAYLGGVAGMSTTGSDGEGPSELSLKDPALNTVFTGSYIQKQEDMYTGTGVDGSALTVKITQQNMEQSTPAWSNYTQYQLMSNNSVKKTTEFSIVNNQVYKNANGSCSVFQDTAASHNPSNWPKTYLKSYVSGKARKVESGVTVNGVITDRYELKLENSPFANSLKEMKTGELYRARKGGYLVKLSLIETWQADKWQGTSTYGFVADKPVTVSNTIDFTYYPNGKLKVIVPGVCAGKVKPAQ